MLTEVIYLLEGVSNSTLTAYIQEIEIDGRIEENRPAVIICPGGAYIGITGKEAEPVALKFLSEGFQAFVLRYSVGPGMAVFPAPFADVAKAISLVRRNAARWGVNPNKIYLCGFSAGGHAAGVLSATWQEDYLVEILNEANDLFRPNALILAYPLLDLYRFKLKNSARSPEMKLLLEMMFNAVYGTTEPDRKLFQQWNCIDLAGPVMPPTFIWATTQDVFVDLEQNLDFVRALAANNIPCEFHLFDKGAHGMGLGDLGDSAYRWFELALSWLKGLDQS